MIKWLISLIAYEIQSCCALDELLRLADTDLWVSRYKSTQMSQSVMGV